MSFLSHALTAVWSCTAALPSAPALAWPLCLTSLGACLALVGWTWTLRRRTRSLETELAERHRTETSLRESEERYRLLTEHSHDFVSEMTPEGRFRYANQNFRLLLGAPPEQLLGRTPMEAGLVHPEDGPRLARTFRSALRRRGRDVVEFRGRQACGDFRWYECAVNCFQGARGEWRMVAISRDIHAQKAADDDLRQHEKLESLGLLAGNIAHDFNNLLAALLGNLGLAEAQVEASSSAHLYLGRAEAAVMKAAELCRQLLAYSGRGRSIIRPEDLHGLVREMTQLLHVSLPKKVRLHLDLDASDPWIEADGTQVRQVLMNLVTNAAEAIGEQEGHIRVSTRRLALEADALATDFPGQTLDPGPFVLLEVADSGCGMTPELQERIFDPFFTTKPTGRGLGLSVMLGILRGHRAGLRIQSEPGLGSTFRIAFPAMDIAPQASATLSRELPVQFCGTALVVEDETEVREALCQVLETLGFDVVAASDGAEAMECFALDPKRYDLVMMDLTMPRMDGREAFQAMRRLHPDIPVILTSGYSQDESLSDPGAPQPSGFLPKPWLLKDLKRTLAACLREPVRPA